MDTPQDLTAGPHSTTEGFPNPQASPAGPSTQAIPTSPRGSKRKRESFYDLHAEREKKYLKKKAKAGQYQPPTGRDYNSSRLEVLAMSNMALFHQVMMAQMQHQGSVNNQFMPFAPMPYPHPGVSGLELNDMTGFTGWQQPSQVIQPQQAFPQQPTYEQTDKGKLPMTPGNGTQYEEREVSITEVEMQSESDEDLDGDELDGTSLDFTFDTEDTSVDDPNTSASTSPTVIDDVSTSLSSMDDGVDAVRLARDTLSSKIQEIKDLFCLLDAAVDAQEKKRIKGLCKMKNEEINEAEKIVAALETAQPKTPTMVEAVQPPQVPAPQPRRYNSHYQFYNDNYQHKYRPMNPKTRLFTGVVSPTPYIIELSDDEDEEGC